MDDRTLNDLATHAGNKALAAVKLVSAVADAREDRLAILNGAIGLLLAEAIYEVVSHLATSMGKEVRELPEDDVMGAVEVVMQRFTENTKIGILKGHRRAVERLRGNG